jgi:hypothetical protein
MGFYDMYQSKKTIRRNFLYWAGSVVLESIGPEMRQYFIETDLDGVNHLIGHAAWCTSAVKKKPTLPLWNPA